MSTLSRTLAAKVRPSSAGWRGARGAAAIALIATLAAGCAGSSNYFYRPVENATAVTNGYPAAHYRIPPNAPRGDVRVASFGVADVGHEEGSDLPSLSVRMVIANNDGQQPWTVDTRQVQVDLHTEAPRGPAFVHTESSDLPVVSIPPGQQRIIDLFYPLPAGRDDAEDVPAFDVIWRLTTDQGVVVERTPFERRHIERPAPAYWQFGHGPLWWYDPWYPGYPILTRTVIVRSPAVPPPRVHIHPPRGGR
jgi:hypothetical protein